MVYLCLPTESKNDVAHFATGGNKFHFYTAHKSAQLSYKETAMSAIDSKHMLEIINILPQNFPAKDGRAAGTIYKAQCLMHGGDGGVVVGQLLIPKTLIETTAGKYLAEFELAVDYKMNVVPRVTALHPWSKPVQSPSAPLSPKTP